MLKTSSPSCATDAPSSFQSCQPGSKGPRSNPSVNSATLPGPHEAPPCALLVVVDPLVAPGPLALRDALEAPPFPEAPVSNVSPQASASTALETENQASLTPRWYPALLAMGYETRDEVTVGAVDLRQEPRLMRIAGFERSRERRIEGRGLEA